MRVRTRSRNQVVSKYYGGSVSIVWTNPDHPPFSDDLSGELDEMYWPEEYSSMTDFVEQHAEVFIDPKTRRWKRIRNPHSVQMPVLSIREDGTRIVLGARARRDQAFKPVHPCTHDSSRIIPREGIGIEIGGIVDSGNPVHERAYAYSYNFPDATAFLGWAGIDTSNLNDLFNDTYYTVTEPPKADMFALSDAFNEACDQFIPSGLMIGEPLYENEIFVSAFKAIINPTSVIPSFFKVVKNYVKRSRRKTLGQVSRELTKLSADKHLGFIFGVMPAIEDIKETLAAHRKVSSRMAFLRQHAGGWVPIRVRQIHAGDRTNVDPGPLSPGVPWDTFTHIDHYNEDTVASAWGRVREDFNWGDTWSAYLQYFGINKMAGLAWELVPFSFVVDWFTNAQERINHFTRLHTGGPFTELRGFTCSTRKEKSELLYLRPGYFPSHGFHMVKPSGPIPLLERKSVDYDRFTEFPDTSGVLDLSNLGLFQFTAGASLLLQRLLR
jgi:peptide methionine sulfoxide reductase MsrB